MPDTAQPFDLTGALPFDGDANDQQPAVLGVAPEHFLYIGQGLTVAQFAAYVQSFNFGRIPPDYVVLHHTAIPSIRAARYPSGAVWDDGEANLSPGQIYEKRRKQLDALKTYYHQTLGWDRGPHLFIDDRYIWLFTPMSAVGIHAKEGNSYKDGAGRLHYSIGIEVLGYYEHVAWPAPVAANVRAALQALSARLGIKLVYTPGPTHTPASHAGSLSSHRDYNKPQCPGAAISEAYYTQVIQATAPADAWANWGNRYPLPPDQRQFGIPSLWKENRWLGEARSAPMYPPDAPGFVCQVFQGGLVWCKDSVCQLVRFGKALP